MKPKAIWAAVASLLLLVSVSSDADDAPPNPVEKPGFTLVFQDEFSGSELDLTKWIPYYLPHWTDSANLENARADYSVEDGKLKLRLARGRQPWSPLADGTCTVSSIQSYNKPGWHRFNRSAAVFSHGTVDINGTMVDIDNFNGFTQKYGYWEIRAKLYTLSNSNGHQAWWTVGDQADDISGQGTDTIRNSEFDIIEGEFSHSANLWSRGTLNWKNRYDVSYADFPRNAANEGPNRPNHLGNEFHIYAMHWTPHGVEYYFDNTLQDVAYVAPRYPHGMIFGMYTNCWDWVTENRPNVWPRTLEVDYVRVWEANEGYTEYPLGRQWVRLRNRCSGNYARRGSIAMNSAEVETTSAISGCPSNEECFRTQWRKVRARNGSHFTLTSHHLRRLSNNPLQVAMIVGEAQEGDIQAVRSKLDNTRTHWTVEPVAGTEFVRFVNVANSNLVMYEDADNNQIKYSANLPADDVRSHWRVVEVERD